MVFNYNEAVSESVSLAEALAPVYKAKAGVSESASIAEVAAALLRARAPLSEASSTIEVLGASQRTAALLDESSSLLEDVAAVYRVAEALDDVDGALLEALSESSSTVAQMGEAVALGDDLSDRYGAVDGGSDALALGESVDDDIDDSTNLVDVVPVQEAVFAGYLGPLRVSVDANSAILARVGTAGDPVTVYVGNRTRVTVKLTDLGGTPVDPVGLRLVVALQGGPVTVYGKRSEIGNGVVRIDAGSYFVEVVPKDAGRYQFAWLVIPAANVDDLYYEGEFKVQPRKLLK